MTEPKIEIPTPDPTRLTTEQLDKGLLSLREILETRIHCMEERIENRRTRIDAEIKEWGVRGQSMVDNLKSLIDEKFGGIKTQFAERDTRTEQTARDTKVAVDAALQAAEKAVGKQNEAFAVATAKSEAATAKQIDAIGILITATNKATDDKITDMKGSISRIDALLASLNGRKQGLGDGWGFVVGAIGVLVGLATVIFMAMKATTGV